MTRLTNVTCRLLICLLLLLAFVAQQWHQGPSANLPAGDFETEAMLAEIIAHGHSHAWDDDGTASGQKNPTTHDLIDHDHPTVMLFDVDLAFAIPQGGPWQ